MAQADRTEKRRERLARQREQELNDLRTIAGNRPGRRLLWRLLEKAHLFETSFTGDVHSTVFREGERNTGLFLFSEISEACPDRITEMMREAKADAQKEERIREKEDADDDSGTGS